MVINCNDSSLCLYKSGFFHYNNEVQRKKRIIARKITGEIMKKTKKKLSLLLCAALLISMLSGCGKEAEEETPFVLRVSVCDAPASLDPAMNTDADEGSILFALYENLMRMSDDGSGQAALSSGMAREYTEETNYDGTVSYRFTLRSSVRWSDGQKVTADDFVYAWQRLADPATESPNHALMSMVAGYDEVRETGDATRLQVSAKDDSTFCVTLSSSCAYFIEGVCTSAATMPLRRDLGNGGVGSVSNGAYRLKDSSASALTLERNGEYYEAKLVGPDELQFVFTDSSEAAWTLYEAGEIDYIGHLPDRVIEQLSQLESWEGTDIYATLCVLYNNQSELFSNEHIRKAFDLAIDRVSAAVAGGAENRAATGLVPYGIEDAPDAESDYRTTGGVLCAVDEEGLAARREEAKSELTFAGYYSTSMFPPIELIYIDEEEDRAVAAALQGMWRDALGVSVMLRSMTQEEYDARMAEGNFELALEKVVAQYNDAMSFLDRWCGGNEQNLIEYDNETYDVLLGVADASDNAVARAAFLHDAETMLLEDTALSPVYFDGTASLLRESLRGVYVDGFGASYFSGVRAAAEQ